MTATYNTHPEQDRLDEALAAATAVRLRAYAPYSRFLVGAALIDAEGGIHVGCNVENASYGLTQCAERSAATTATATGKRDIVACVIITDTEEPTMPCGACRQVLAEFNLDVLVVSRTLSGKEARFALSELLPHSFDPSALPGKS
jgi:cytidine deaminase